MKRFLVFAWDEHYPGGGFKDFVGSETTREKALELLRVTQVSKGKDEGHVVDSETGNILEF